MRLLPRLIALSVLLGTPALAGTVPPGCEEDAATCKEDCTIEYGGNGAAIKKLTRCFDGCLQQRTQCARQFNAVNNRAPDAPEAAPERRMGKTEAAKLRDIKEKDRRRDDDPFGDDENKPVRARPVRDSYDEPPEPTPERTSFRAADVLDPKPAKPQAPVPAKAAEPARPPPPPSPAVAPEPEPRRSQAPDIEAFAEPPPRAEPTPRKPEPKPVVAEPARPSHSDDEDAPPPPPVAKKEPAPRPAPPPRPEIPKEPAKKDISEWDPNGD
ncbi:hypothetical protein [Corallococcus sp. EGB]|uniref:hypothetical protein n=1 Tax=Corallococcus sp. EGB TaxID=1521117 RepID=UPI001CC19048|nr:hypothetical protein [Corallococcus sp. EGB]